MTANLITDISYERKQQPFWGNFPKFNTVEKTKSFLYTMLKVKSPTWFSEIHRIGPQLTSYQSHLSE